MRIIKINDIAIIMGEVLNILRCAQKYIDGKVIDEPLIGYPRIPFDGGYDVLRAIKCVVYVNNTMDVNNVKRALAVLEDPVINTYTKYSRTSNDLVVDRYRNKVSRGDVEVVVIDNFDFSTNYHDHMQVHMLHQVASIFWDVSDLCVLEHNAVTFTFDKTLMRGYANVIDHKLKQIANVDILTTELSSYWSQSSLFRNNSVHNINATKVRRRNFKDLEFIGNAEQCNYCNSQLFGDNYALAGDVQRPKVNCCVAACALCVHTDKKIERNYIAIFRVTYPKTVESMIESASSELIPIYRAIMKKHSYERIANVDVQLLGDEYAIIEEKCVLFTNITSHDLLVGRKILLKQYF